jgi:hypothetical protein
MRTISIFLLTIHFFAATELTQLFKLPVLLEHFNQHQQKDKTLSFGTFLYQHYVADQNNGDHDELPFHSHDSCITLSVSVCPPTFLVGIDVPVVYMETRHNTIFSDQSIPLTYLSTIWQPPRTV